VFASEIARYHWLGYKIDERAREACGLGRKSMRFPLVVTVAVTGVVCLLYWVEPVAGSIYPPCLFHALTGLYCPGCGSTRCLHALLHGNLKQAAAFNVLLVSAIPFLLCLGVGSLWRTTPTAPGCRISARVIYAVFGVIVAYWLLRNVPYSPFHLLAPHVLS
jgi:hypothetical protein